MTVALANERFPFLFQGKEINIGAVDVLVKVKLEFANTHNESTVQLALAPGNAAPTSTGEIGDSGLIVLSTWNGLLKGSKDFASPPPSGNWTMNVWLNGGSRLDPNAVENIVLLCHYRVE